MEMLHSACPSKTDIHPGRFVLMHTSALSRHDMAEWKCELCGTVVLVVTERQKEATASLSKAELLEIMSVLEYSKYVDSYLDEAEEAIRIVTRALNALGPN